MKSEHLQPKAWGLRVNDAGELMVGNHGAVGLARKYGTPLHVMNEHRLIKIAKRFLDQVTAAYPGISSVHYALKCNSVPAVVEAIRYAGLNAEVMTEYELSLATRLGFASGQIIVNGPCKTEVFLRRCLEDHVRFIIVDSIDELQALVRLAQENVRPAPILLRVNPDYLPRTMNRGTATGSRKGCAFGLDLKGGEVMEALALLKRTGGIDFRGFQFHIGTGIHDPSDYSRALERMLPQLISLVRYSGFSINVLDVGGGFASMTSREFTTRELLAYQGFDHLPGRIGTGNHASVEHFAREITQAVTRFFGPHELPELVYEPGRCIVSANQFLLLTVHRVKSRRLAGTWLITDGGLSTVTMPTYYENHEVFLCNDIERPRRKRVTIIGPACFAGDIVYRNKLMPTVQPGEVLAIMDSGAYFTALESSFGFPRPAIVSVNGATCRIVRIRETFEEMIARDVMD